MTAGEWLASPFRYEEGWVDYVDVAQPAAGANASVSVPGQYGMRVLAARAKLTTSATVANRYVSLDYIDANSVTRARNITSVAIAASATAQPIEWNHAWHVSDHSTGSTIVVPVMPLLVPPAWSIRFTVDGIDTTDQLASLSLVVEKVPTGA